MLLNRAKDEQFSNEGIYVSFAPSLEDPAAWRARGRSWTAGAGTRRSPASSRGGRTNSPGNARGSSSRTFRAFIEFRR
jgi:hypothetical protein